MIGKSLDRTYLSLLRVHRARLIEFSLFFGSVVALQGGRFVFTLVVAAGLRPADFTDWAQFVTFVGYAPAMLLGAGNGMNGLVPILIGRGDAEQANEVEGSTWLAALAATSAALVLAVALTVAHASAWLIGALIAGSVVAIYQVQQFGMRSRLQFNIASLQQMSWAMLIMAGCALQWLLVGRSLDQAMAIWTASALLAVVVGFAVRWPSVQVGPCRARSALREWAFPSCS